MFRFPVAIWAFWLAAAPAGGLAPRAAARCRGGPLCARRGNTAAIIAERFLDTLEDVALHASRQSREKPGEVDVLRGSWATSDDLRPRVLVLGSGWAAHALVKIIDTNRYRVLVVSPRPFFVFTPMLTSTAVGTVEYRSVCEPIRASNPLAGFLEGSCTAVHPESKSVDVELKSCEANETVKVAYDTLVYACGVGVADFGVPGVLERCHFVKEIADAQKLRRAIAQALETALSPALNSTEARKRCLSFVVVGGGATGVELAAELADFVRDAVARVYPQLKPLVSITLLHAGGELLPQFDAGLRGEAKAALEAAGITVRLKTRAKQVNADSVDLSDGTSIPCGVCVWSAGTAPRPLTQQLVAACGEAQADAKACGGAPYGKVAVDDWLRVVGAEGILALGDAAAVADEDSEECVAAGAERRMLPQTAQCAAQQGAYAARLLNRGYDITADAPTFRDPGAVDKALLPLVSKLRGVEDPYEAPPFRFLNLGILAYTGGGRAISQVQVGDDVVIKQAGSIGFLLWRSVYLAKQVATRNRVLVAFDWLKSAAFGRDVTKL